jgi:SAM-dependent methyltransferase
MRKGRFAATLLAALIALAAAQPSPGRHPISGREFARPMGVGGAPWLERPEREREEQTTRALQLLQLAPGMTVADIGAGSGYFTERIARIVGPSGRIYATDIQPGMISLLEKRVSRERLHNVTIILGEPSDPRLPASSLDVALMVDVYHELWSPQAVLAHIKAALRPQGRLILIEYKGEEPTIPILPSHKMTIAQAKLELEGEGFVLAAANSSLPLQHVLTFSKR